MGPTHNLISPCVPLCLCSYVPLSRQAPSGATSLLSALSITRLPVIPQKSILFQLGPEPARGELAEPVELTKLERSRIPPNIF